MTLGADGVVLAAEGDDADIHPLFQHGRNPVGVEAGAIDYVAGLKRPLGRLHRQRASILRYAVNRGFRKNVTAGMGETVGVGLRYFNVVCDAGAGRPEGPNAGRVRLYFPQTLRADHFQPPRRRWPLLAHRDCPGGQVPTRRWPR